MTTQNSKPITTQNYWEDYYKNNGVEVSQIIKTCGAYDILWDNLIRSCTETPKTIIEIGAYPGRYLAYLASRYNLHATAFDYNSDKSKIEETFKVMNVASYEIIQADLLSYTPEPKYDIVISNGFIEHFEDYKSVVEKHAGFMNKGGVMFIMVPNKRYFRKWFDWLCDYENFKIHNTKCMSKSEFRNFAIDNNLQIINIDYFGSFVYNVHQPLNIIQKLIHNSTRFVFKKLNPFISGRPNKYFSSILFGIYKK